MYSEEFYNEYFEGLATQLADLSHTPQKEHFYYNTDAGNGFKELQDAIGGRLGMPALILDEPNIESDGSSTGQKLTLLGGFAVLDAVDPGDVRAIRRARIATQKIARKLINRMKRDCRIQFGEDATLLGNNCIQLGQIRQYGTPVIMGQLSGWAVEFQWLMPDDITYGQEDFT